MVEFFANSLVQGFLDSNLTGQAIVLAQLIGSVVMVACAIGKWRQLKDQKTTMRRVSRDVMGGHDVLGYYLARRPNMHSAIENIYNATCERMLKLLSPDVRAEVMAGTSTTAAAITTHEMELVKALCDHMLDEEEIRIEKGMGMISTVVALSPMLGLLGTVWGVLDAFAQMGGGGANGGTFSISDIAPSISSALVTTVVGLLVAIPGVVAYNRMSAIIRGLVADMEGFADDLLGRLALDYQGRNV